MSITGPAGFEAAGIAAGIKRTGALDLALVVNRGPSRAGAAVFTSNRAKANPILWSQQAVQDGVVSAVVLNSGGANCFTGPEGFQVTHRTAEAAASALHVSAGDVLVCSTGLIGDQLDGEVLEEGVLSAANRLASDEAAHVTGQVIRAVRDEIVHMIPWSNGDSITKPGQRWEASELTALMNADIFHSRAPGLRY